MQWFQNKVLHIFIQAKLWRKKLLSRVVAISLWNQCSLKLSLTSVTSCIIDIFESACNIHESKNGNLDTTNSTSENFWITQKVQSTRTFYTKKCFVDQPQTSDSKTVKSSKTFYEFNLNSHGRPDRVFIIENHLKVTCKKSKGSKKLLNTLILYVVYIGFCTIQIANKADCSARIFHSVKNRVLFNQKHTCRNYAKGINQSTPKNPWEPI